MSEKSGESDSGPEAAAGDADPLFKKTIAEMTGKEFGELFAKLNVARPIQQVDPRIAGVHVNSGPPGFENSGGHANFDPKSQVFDRPDVLGRGASHVNSGPPGFENSGGHANFDPKSQVFDRPDVLGRGASHVNSGPPGFENSGGHANFDPKSQVFDRAVIVTLPDGGQVTLPPGRVDMTVRGFRIQR